jgi:hypothetical protein
MVWPARLAAPPPAPLTKVAAAFDIGDLAVDIRLEVVVLPVSNVDRAKEFYVRFGVAS